MSQRAATVVADRAVTPLTPPGVGPMQGIDDTPHAGVPRMNPSRRNKEQAR